MNSETRDSAIAFFRAIALLRFPVSKRQLLLIILAVLAAAILVEFFVLGLARRTFLFYTGNERTVIVEDRMLRVSRRSPVHSSSREVNITRYVEEALLGPVSPDALPLFPAETRLLSLLYRNGVVYADFSKDAALPPETSLGRGVLGSLRTLHSGIKRNFPFVRNVRFFIDGKAAYADNFR